MFTGPSASATLEERVKKHLVFLDLKEHHAVYCRESFSELRPSYHNEEHCFSTALSFFELALESEIGLEEARHGFVAALYHDANHRMAKRDRVNVDAAVSWVKANDFFEASLDLERVCELIEATDNARMSFESKTEELLHDADVLQTVKGTLWENLQWQARLAEELMATVDLKSSLKFVAANLKAEESLRYFHRLLGQAKQQNRLH